MNGWATMDPGGGPGHPEVLSGAEEGALGIIRQAMARLRARGLVVGLEGVERALIEVGAAKLADAPEGDGPRWRLQGAHFTVRARPQPGDGIEFDFGPPGS